MAWPFSLWSDLRYAARSLSRTPGFTTAAVLTLALGIGVNVALFSLFQQILLRGLPVPEPERLVNLIDPGPDPGRRVARASLAGETDAIFSYPMFRDLEQGQGAFAGIAAHRIFDANLSTGEQARLESGVFVSGGYFPSLGLQPALGRLLGTEDDRVDGQAESVVLSHEYWRSAFSAEPDVIGRRFLVNGTPLTIVGVAPPGFHGTTVGSRASVFVPITFRAAMGPGALPNHDDRGVHWVHVFARLAPGLTREEAAAAINALYRPILNEIEAPLLTDVNARELEAFRAKSLVLQSGARGQSLLLAPARQRLELFLAVGVVVLLLCCANIAGLMLVRGTVRSGEMAVRASMGATSGRLLSLLLTESLAVALPAAFVSLGVAWWTLRGIASTVPGIPTDAGRVAPGAAFEVSLSSGPVLVAIGIAVASALAFGLFPARNLMRTHPAQTLQSYGAKQTSSKGLTRFRTALATVQVALAMALLATTGLFVQSLANIARVDLGIDTDSVVTFSISPQASGYAPDATAGLFDRLEQELAGIPGVASVGSASFGLLGGGSFRARGLAVDGTEIEEEVPVNFVSPDYFRTLGIGLLRGRAFGDSDSAGAPEVVIVNQRFAERLGFDGDILGRVFSEGWNGEIVGLVADAKAANVTDEIGPQLFLPRRQSPFGSGSLTFYVRGDRPPEDLVGAIRATVAGVAPIVPISNLRTMEQQVDENIATERFIAGAATAFAVLATLLAGIGLYGVLAFTVAQRSREIALRIALGATGNRIRVGVLRRVAAMALAGTVIGTVAAVLLGRAARSLIFGVDAASPIALAGAAVAVTVVTIGAAYIPSRRASRVDPMTALRYE